jgi:hypothetical protein
MNNPIVTSIGVNNVRDMVIRIQLPEGRHVEASTNLLTFARLAAEGLTVVNVDGPGMTPSEGRQNLCVLQLQILLHYRALTGDPANIDSPAGRQAIRQFVRAGYLRASTQEEARQAYASYRLTERGDYFVDGLLTQPARPELNWNLHELMAR